MSEFSKLAWHKRTHGHDFTGAEFRVLMSIFDATGPDGRNAYPGVKRLMAETGYGRTGVIDAVKALKDRGWIEEASRGSGKSGAASVFHLVPDAPSRSARADQPSRSGQAASRSAAATAWSGGPDRVGPVDRTPTDPLPDPGSDPGSDPWIGNGAQKTGASFPRSVGSEAPSLPRGSSITDLSTSDLEAGCAAGAAPGPSSLATSASSSGGGSGRLISDPWADSPPPESDPQPVGWANPPLREDPFIPDA